MKITEEHLDKAEKNIRSYLVDKKVYHEIRDVRIKPDEVHPEDFICLFDMVCANVVKACETYLDKNMKLLYPFHRVMWDVPLIAYNWESK